jgi:hypothetical protein
MAQDQESGEPGNAAGVGGSVLMVPLGFFDGYWPALIALPTLPDPESPAAKRIEDGTF